MFATTAANPDEPSEGCYFDDKRQTALGDVYSVNWMQDSDKVNLLLRTTVIKCLEIVLFFHFSTHL